MSIISLPNILFSIPRGASKLSDIEFLAIKEFDGKLVTNENTRTTIGTLCTLTAQAGKDMYIARAGFTGTGGSSSSKVKIELQADGVVLETALLTVDANSGENPLDFKFSNIGYKVATSQIIKLEIVSITSTTVEGFVECWEEYTNATPQV